MKAVIETGGKQIEVSPNQVVSIEKLCAKEGETFETDKVLLVRHDGDVLIGSPYVTGAKVVGRIVKQDKGRKVVVFKYKPKKNYRRKLGHRQPKTQVLIQDIVIRET